MLTPSGVRDLIPDAAEDQQEVIHTISSVIKSYNYRKVITPTIEYFSSLESGMVPAFLNQAIRFFDPSGDMLILRPDFTTPLARMVATYMSELPKPIRVSYSGPVFRRQNGEENMEIFQIGLEHIGDNSPAADAEVISVCIESLLALGLTEFGVDIGHVDFLRGLSAEQRQALLDDDYIQYGAIPPVGGVEVVSDFPHLVAIHHILKQKGYDQYVTFNKGLIKQIDYYTGIIFECYVKGIGQPVGSGGRYDALLQHFGVDLPAVGFALNVDPLIQLTCKQKG